MKIRRYFSRVFRKPEPGDDGGGTAVIEAPAATTSEPPAPAAEPPKTAMEAMFPKTETAEQTEARLRDERGRFAAKQNEPVDPSKPIDPLKPAEAIKPADPLAPPAGLTPAASERFQTLANTNKELSALRDQAAAIAGSPDAVLPMLQNAQELHQTFQEHGVTRDQFIQATAVIGMLNRGDFSGAQAALQEQLQQISLMTGQPIAPVDALSNFPDLREAVDNMQVTERHALEIARSRVQQLAGRQRQEQQHQEQQQTQQAQQAMQQGQLAVDKFCKSKMSTDLDYARVEPILLKQIQSGLLEGVPPSAWASIVQKTYELVRESSTMSRGATITALRPSGADQATQKPASTYEAMWGKPKPSGV